MSFSRYCRHINKSSLSYIGLIVKVFLAFSLFAAVNVAVNRLSDTNAANIFDDTKKSESGKSRIRNWDVYYAIFSSPSTLSTVIVAPSEKSPARSARAMRVSRCD
mgnify:FL=1